MISGTYDNQTMLNKHASVKTLVRKDLNINDVKPSVITAKCITTYQSLHLVD